ncbi:MAG: hypothetical protein EA357_02760 [Micavibrio sp.]|nr:MAG: hypothetical protein EA357_02760 [Micavibrio sp.]
MTLLKESFRKNHYVLNATKIPQNFGVLRSTGRVKGRFTKKKAREVFVKKKTASYLDGYIHGIKQIINK